MYLQHTQPGTARRRPASSTGRVLRLQGLVLTGQSSPARSQGNTPTPKSNTHCPVPDLEAMGSSNPCTLCGGITLHLQGRQMSQGQTNTRPDPAGRRCSHPA